MAQILIVDDDPDILEACRLVLEKEGHVVRCASNRAGGLEAVAAAAPDLLILDVMMEEPDDGLAMARQLRKQGFEAADHHAHQRQRRHGPAASTSDDEMVPVDEFQPKPVEPKVLVAKVDKLLGR